MNPDKPTNRPNRPKPTNRLNRLKPSKRTQRTKLFAVLWQRTLPHC
ncbi:hypothetical protein J7M23_08045 [Candidatus Sumerlaeota bacterium]|nr:hypothetical protein [Candidatus Sumerlaeota bacterium]